jgi:hypothetical protein
MIVFILKVCGNFSHTWRKTILRRVVVFTSTDLLCHMATPPTKRLHGSPLGKERKERKEEVRAKGIDNSTLIYSFSIYKIYIYYDISNEGNVIHRRRIPNPSLLLASF